MRSKHYYGGLLRVFIVLAMVATLVGVMVAPASANPGVVTVTITPEITGAPGDITITVAGVTDTEEYLMAAPRAISVVVRSKDAADSVTKQLNETGTGTGTVTGTVTLKTATSSVVTTDAYLEVGTYHATSPSPVDRIDVTYTASKSGVPYYGRGDYDAQAPGVTTATAAVSGGNIVVTIEATDDPLGKTYAKYPTAAAGSATKGEVSGIVAVEVSVNDGAWVTVLSQTAAVDAALTYTLYNPGGGTYVIKVRAKDYVGNTTAVPATATAFIDPTKLVAQQVQQIRQLDFLQDVPTRVISREQHIQNTQQELAALPQEQWDLADQTLNALHLLPEVMSARQIMETFYGSAVLAYYDTSDDSITYIQDRASQSGLEAILAHELTHALTDQHFPETYNQLMTTTLTDVDSAIRSLIEGDAQMVMATYKYLHRPQSLHLGFIPSLLLSAEELPEIEVPEAISLFFQFPYIEGINFISSLWEQTTSWEIVNQAYLNPPQSSEQVIHPEKYPQESPVDVSVPSRVSEKWQIAGTDRLGELALFVMFYNKGLAELAPLDGWWTYSSPLSEGWAGDELVVYKSSEGQFGYAWIVKMDTLQDAEELLSGYQLLLGGLGAQGEGALWGLGENDFIKVQRKGDRVAIVRGPSPQAIAELWPFLGTVSGRALLQGRSNHGGIIAEASEAQASSTEQGAFSLQLLEGAYEVTVSKPGYLSTHKTGVAVLEEATVTLPEVTLLAGDASGDGKINFLDLTTIATSFNTAAPSSPETDVNADGEVNIFDLAFAALNFGKDQSPWTGEPTTK